MHHDQGRPRRQEGLRVVRKRRTYRAELAIPDALHHVCNAGDEFRIVRDEKNLRDRQRLRSCCLRLYVTFVLQVSQKVKTTRPGREEVR